MPFSPSNFLQVPLNSPPIFLDMFSLKTFHKNLPKDWLVISPATMKHKLLFLFIEHVGSGWEALGSWAMAQEDKDMGLAHSRYYFPWCLLIHHW